MAASFKPCASCRPAIEWACRRARECEADARVAAAGFDPVTQSVNGVRAAELRRIDGARRQADRHRGEQLELLPVTLAERAGALRR